jgi:hypothetical protein
MKIYVHRNQYLTCVNIEAVTFCEWHPSLPAVCAIQVRESTASSMVDAGTDE